MCKARSTDRNPITLGEDRYELFPQIVWLKGVPGNPDGCFCKVCFTNFKFSYKREYEKATNLLDAFAAQDGHILYAGCPNDEISQLKKLTLLSKMPIVSAF